MSSIQNTIRWRSDRLDGAVVMQCLGTPGQTKVSGDCQRETTHEICCLAAEWLLFADKISFLLVNQPKVTIRLLNNKFHGLSPSLLFDQRFPNNARLQRHLADRNAI
jgi:hypothetical protein